MIDLAELKVRNAARWLAAKLDQDRQSQMIAAASRLTAPDAKTRYLQIEKGTGVPWWVVAVIHEREASGPPHWNVHIGQGDPLDRVTTHEPAGRGPFYGADAFYRGALDALIDCPPYAARNTDWSPGGTLTLLERYNGLGYAQRGAPSPYVWSGTDQYERGKYVADHVYDPNVRDVQLGCAALIKCMMKIDSSIRFGAPLTQTAPTPKPAPPAFPVSDATKHGTAGAVAAAGAAAAAAAWQSGFQAGVVTAIAVVAAIAAAGVWVYLHFRQKR